MIPKLPKCLLKENPRRCSAYYQQRGEVIMTEIPNCLNKWGKKSPLLSSCHSLLHIHLCTQKIVLIFSFVFPQTVRETKDTGEWSWVRTAPPGEEGRGPGCAKGGLRSRGRSAWVTLCVCVCVCVCSVTSNSLQPHGL